MQKTEIIKGRMNNPPLMYLKGMRPIKCKSPITMTPKYDLHRHLGGSALPEFAYALSTKHKMGLTFKQIRKMTTFQPGDDNNFAVFLNKFKVFDDIPWTSEDINDFAHHVVGGLINEGITYSEIRFSVNKYLNGLRLTNPIEVIKLIKSSFDDATVNTNVQIGLILALKYESNIDDISMAKALDKYADCVVGIDLVGNEAYFDADKFKAVMDIWSQNNKGISVHVGESQSAVNARQAVAKLKINRIAHGIRIPGEDPELLNICKDKNICFDIAVTSNILTGVVADIKSHPAIKMLENGNIITIGTDDPCVCRTTLDKEYRIIQENWGLADADIHKIMKNSIVHSFKGK